MNQKNQQQINQMQLIRLPNDLLSLIINYIEPRYIINLTQSNKTLAKRLLTHFEKISHQPLQIVSQYNHIFLLVLDHVYGWIKPTERRAMTHQYIRYGHHSLQLKQYISRTPIFQLAANRSNLYLHTQKGLFATFIETESTKEVS